MRNVFAGVLALALLAMPCMAEDPVDPQAEAAKALAACKEAMAKLNGLCGEWTETATYHPSEWMPKGGSGTATSSCAAWGEGTWLSGTYEGAMPDGHKYSARSMWGYDAKSGCYTMHWFSNMGEVERYEGKLDGKVLTMNSTTPDMGFTMCLQWTFHDADHHKFAITMTAGGETKPFMNSEVCRKGVDPLTCTYGCGCGKEKTVAIDAPAPN